MKEIKILLSSIFVILTVSASAQTNDQALKSTKTEVVNTTVTVDKKSPHGHVLIQESPEILRANRVESKSTASGLRGSEIVGEGQYLNQDKVIMERSVSGKIPVDFPKHIVGQSPEKYEEVVMAWARQNLHFIKPEYHHEIK